MSKAKEKKPWTVDGKELTPDQAMRFLWEAQMIEPKEFARAYGRTRFDENGDLVMADGTPVKIKDP